MNSKPKASCLLCLKLQPKTDSKTYPFTDKLRTTNWQNNPVEIHMAKTMFEKMNKRHFIAQCFWQATVLTDITVRFWDKNYCFPLLGLFTMVRCDFFQLVYQGHRFYDICKTCGPPKQCEIYTHCAWSWKYLIDTFRTSICTNILYPKGHQIWHLIRMELQNIF